MGCKQTLKTSNHIPIGCFHSTSCCMLHFIFVWHIMFTLYNIEYAKQWSSNMNLYQDNSLLIAQTLTKYFPIEQARLSMYHVDDIYYRIPCLVFRLQGHNNGTSYNDIKVCIDSFIGNIKWTIYKYRFSRKDNYVLAPYILYQIEEKMYTERIRNLNINDLIQIDEFRDICEKAIEDIPKLAEYINNFFKA